VVAVVAVVVIVLSSRVIGMRKMSHACEPIHVAQLFPIPIEAVPPPRATAESLEHTALL